MGERRLNAALMNARLDAGRRNELENEAVAPSLIFSGHAPRQHNSCFTPPSLLTRADEVIDSGGAISQRYLAAVLLLALANEVIE
jgi:hypothetical protein